MRETMVGGVPVNEASGIMQDFWGKIGKSITWEEFKRFLRRENPFIVENWLDVIVEREKRLHKDFFGKNFAKKFDYSQFSATLEKYGEAKFTEWKELGLEPHFLPPVIMSQDRRYPGWKVKPEPWFYDNVANGNISGNPLDFGGVSVLVDIRCKPAYNNGEQMWENDNLLGEIISQLREGEEIADYSPRVSRFKTSASIEIEQKIAPVWAMKIGLEPSQARLEREIEFNFFSQMLTDTPRSGDGTTNTWLWFADHFKSAQCRLYGGDSGSGGFADVDYYSAVNHWFYGSFRLLAVL